MGRQRAPPEPCWRRLLRAGCRWLLSLCGTALRGLRGLWSLTWVGTTEPLPPRPPRTCAGSKRGTWPQPGQGRCWVQSLHHCCCGLAFVAARQGQGCNRCTAAVEVCCSWAAGGRGRVLPPGGRFLAQGAAWLCPPRALGTQGLRCRLCPPQGSCEPPCPPGPADVLQELLGWRLPGHRGGGNNSPRVEQRGARQPPCH